MMSAAASGQGFVPDMASGIERQPVTMAGRVKNLTRPVARSSFFLPGKPTVSKPSSAAAMNAPDGTKIYGGVVYADSWSSSYAPYGIYSSTVTAPLSVSQFYTGEIFKVNGGGFYANGKYYFIDYEIRTFDGEEVVYTYLYDSDAYPFHYNGYTSLGMSHIAKDLTFDPIEQRVYGVFSVGNLEDSYLVGAMSLDDFKIEEFCDLPATHVAIAADQRGNIYTIGADGVVYRLDKEAREMVTVGATGVGPVEARYAQSATIDLNTGVFYWAALHTDGTSALYTVDTTTGLATKVGDFPDNEEFAGIYVPDIVDGGAPAAAEELFPEFENGSLSGIVAFDAPKKRHDGYDLSGDITWVLKTNGEETHRGTVKAGKRNYEIEMTLPGNGFYTFTLTLENAAGKSLPTSLRAYIGNDNPVACPAAVAINNDRDGKVDLKWMKPRRGQHGGYVDTAAIVYDIVRLPDGVQVATAHPDTVFTDNIERTDLVCYRYTITPIAAGLRGEPVMTNKVAVGHVAEIPYRETFDTDVDFSTWSVADVHNDAANNWGTWGQSGYQGGVATATPASGNYTGNPKDDWLFTPPVHLRADRTYKLTYRAMSQGNRVVPSFREYMEVKMGASPEVAAMTETLLENCEIDNAYMSYNSYEHVLYVPEEGNYHIGFHATTPGDPLMWNLVLDDVAITEGAMLDGPARVDDFEVMPGEKGALQAAVSFKSPTKAVDGTPLEGISRIEILRGTEVIKTYTVPGMGEQFGYVDTDAVQGDNEYTVVVWDNNEKRGLEAKKKVYVGFDIPGQVANIALHDVDGVVTLTWDAPSETGPSGHYVDPEGVTYTVVRYFSDYNYEEVAENISERVFVDKDVTAGVQTQVVYRVKATNDVGTGKEVTSPSIFIGGIDAVLPLHESFPGRYSTCEALRYISCENGTAWGVTDVIDNIRPVDGDGGMALFGLTGSIAPGENGLTGMLYTNRVSVAATVNPAVSFYFYHTSGSRNILDILVNPETDGWQTVSTIPVSDPDGKEGWTQVVVPLSQFSPRRYIQIGFRGTAFDDEIVYVDNIVIDDMLDHNLELTSISANPIAVPGENHLVSVVVTNRGLNEASDYFVTLSSESGDFSTSEPGFKIEPGNSATFEFAFPVTLGTPDVNNLVAEIDYEADMKVADNRSETVTVNVDLPRMAGVSDLAADDSEGTVVLTWSEPDVADAIPEPVTDDFESYSPFIISNIGSWELYDGDGQYTWGISDGTGGGSILKYDNAGKPMAWQVFNPVLAGLSVDYTPGEEYELPDWRPYSGSQMLISYAPRTGFSDDWLISEELTGMRQIVGFMGRSIMTNYAERVELLASSTDNAPESFIKIAENNLGKEWRRIAAVVPEGTRYFAIRCTSPQQFATIIDDVTYTPADASPAASSLIGYNVYRDGVKVNDAPIEETVWTDNDGGSHTYRVSAVYDIGESRLSNEVSAGKSGIGIVASDGEFKVTVSGHEIRVVRITGSAVGLYMTDGRLAGRDDSDSPEVVFKVVPGIYLVQHDGRAVKVVVK